MALQFQFFARNSPAALKNDGPKSNTSPTLHPAALIAGPSHAPSKDACVLVQQHGVPHRQQHQQRFGNSTLPPLNPPA
jgi:hypothetical protein